MNKTIYFAWINNHTDSRDDDVLKISAANKKTAERYAEVYASTRGNCSVGDIYTRKEFKKDHPEWHSLLWGVESEEAYKND